LLLISDKSRDAVKERGARGHLSFSAPRRCDLLGSLSEKRESMPILCVVAPQKYIFFGADFGSTIALDLQQKLKHFLHKNKQQCDLSSEFIALSCSSEVLFVKFL